MESQLSKFSLKLTQKRNYYIQSQLEQHNTPNDLWVALFDQIYDLSELVQRNRNKVQVEPLIQAAGTDITHWFDAERKPREHLSSEGKEKFYTPMGKFLDIDLAGDYMQLPWWKNQDLIVGKLTKRSRKIRIINTLSDTQDILEVPQEETLHEILDRLLKINCHAKSYTFKRNQQNLKMNLTLSQNGIEDETELYEELQVPQHERYIPAIHIHFNDDLTSM